MELKLVEASNPVLKQKCDPIEEWTQDHTLLGNRMIEIMKESKGVGLAAPQVGLPIRFFVAETDGHQICMANPEIIQGEEKEWLAEGCLSFPGIQVPVLRSIQIELKGLIGPDEYSTLALEGFLARVVQHEIEHLDGICHVDYLSKFKRQRAIAKMKKYKKKMRG